MSDSPYDPRKYDNRWAAIDSPGGSYPEEAWSIEAWNDEGGSCHCSGPWGQTLAQAIERAEQFKLYGDNDGRKYDHVDVVYRVWRTCIKTRTFTLDEARQML